MGLWVTTAFLYENWEMGCWARLHIKITWSAWKYIVLSPISRASDSVRAKASSIIYTGQSRSTFKMWLHKTEFILILVLINYCIIFHMNHWKPTFAVPRPPLNKHKWCKIMKWEEVEYNKHIRGYYYTTACFQKFESSLSQFHSLTMSLYFF